MNRSLATPLVAALATLLSFVLVAPAAQAADVTWAADGNQIWEEPDSDGDFGAATYQSGNTVLFDGTAPGTIAINAAGVNPGSVTFSGGDHTFQFGAIGSEGTSIVSNGGTQVFSHTTYAAGTDLTFDGGVTITDGIVRFRVNSDVDARANADGIDVSFGAADNLITLNGGTFHFRVDGVKDAGADLLNPIAVGPNGGTLDLRGNAASHRYHPQIGDRNTPGSGAIGLGGNLDILLERESPTADNVNIWGDLTLSADVKVTTQPHGYQSVKPLHLRGAISGPAHILTLGGTGTFGLHPNATGSNLDLAGLTIDTADHATLLNVTVADSDVFQTIRGNSGAGSVTLADNARLRIHHDAGQTQINFNWTDFSFGQNNTVTLTNAHDGTINFVNSEITVGGDENVDKLIYALSRRYRLSLNGGAGTLIVGQGGEFEIRNADNYDNNYGIIGNVRLLDGAVVNLNSSQVLGFNHGYSGNYTLFLGDGSPATSETVTFTGNNLHGYIGYRNAVNDDGSTVLEYISDPASTSVFLWANGGAHNVQDVYSAVAGNRFAPGEDGAVLMLGAAGAPIMTVASPTTLATAGTVSFHEAGAFANRRYSTGNLGELAISSSGSFTISNDAGKVEAGVITVGAGGELSGIGTFDAVAINVSGAVKPGGSIGILTMGSPENPTTVTFENGGALVVEMTGSMAPGVDYDVLEVYGNVIFEEGASLLLSQDYMPGLESWDILNVTGTVSGWEFLTLPDKYVLSFGNNVLTLSQIPEPSAGLLLALGSLLALRRRRK